MASCAYCGSTLLWMKKKVDGLQFCNDRCVAQGHLVRKAQKIPEPEALDLAMKYRNGPCPVCAGSGPIDVFTSHSVWSAILMTSWQSTPRVSCRSCGRKAQAKDLATSLLLGWWGFPWGLVVTPIQLVRNLAGMASGPAAGGPSPKLLHRARLELAANRP